MHTYCDSCAQYPCIYARNVKINTGLILNYFNLTINYLIDLLI